MEEMRNRRDGCFVGMPFGKLGGPKARDLSADVEIKRS